VKCVRDIRDWPPEKYRLPNDGRKAKRKWEQRQRLAMYLATFADGDGSRVEVGTKRMHEALGMSRSQLFVYLEDLKTLKVLINEGRTTSRGAAARRLNVEALAGQESGIGDTKSPGLGGQESGIDQSKSPGLAVQESGIDDQRSGIGGQESGVGPDRTVTNRHIPTHTDLEKVCVCLQKRAAIVELNWPMTEKEATAIEKLGREHGRDRVIAAGRFFLENPPSSVNARTWHPWAAFIGGIHLYLKSVEVQVRKEASAITPEQIAATNLNHLHAWCKDNPGQNAEVIDGKIVCHPKEEEPGPEALFEEPKTP
jgi:hypothetical protein